MKKGNKAIKRIITAAVILALFTAVLLICRRENIRGETAEDRTAFAKSLGYCISGQNEAKKEIVIPSVFSDVYENYNALQKSAGFDLSAYKGEQATVYTYPVTNHPGGDSVIMNIIVYKGRIIGGDICSAEFDGFMTGLAAKENGTDEQQGNSAEQ